MLHEPRYNANPAAAASAFTSFRATSSSDGKHSKSDRKSVSSFKPAAYWMSSDAFQPKARTAKLSIPRAMGTEPEESEEGAAGAIRGNKTLEATVARKDRRVNVFVFIGGMVAGM
jgi:hypothetical protein